jgi:hypothetical protein
MGPERSACLCLNCRGSRRSGPNVRSASRVLTCVRQQPSIRNRSNIRHREEVLARQQEESWGKEHHPATLVAQLPERRDKSPRNLGLSHMREKHTSLPVSTRSAAASIGGRCCRNTLPHSLHRDKRPVRDQHRSIVHRQSLDRQHAAVSIPQCRWYLVNRPR